jgi:outer membrane protein insertion porin family
VAITEKNFNYKGLGCFWKDGFKRLRGGGEYLNLSATFGNKSRKYELSWTKPYFMDTKWTVGFDLELSNTRYISEDYNIDASGITLHASYQVNPFLRTGWHYRLRNTHIHITEKDPAEQEKHIQEIMAMTDPVKKQDALDDLIRKEKAYEKLCRQAKHAGLVSAIGTTLYYDSTDHPMAPTQGFKSRLGAEVAGVGGYHSFIGLSYLNTYYYRLHRRGALKFRCDLKFLIPYGDTDVTNLPIDERLFLGGDTTVRGYRSYRLGPSFGDKGDPEGGISLQFYSAEYNRKIIKNLDAFIFIDAGHLSNKYFHFGYLHTAAGYGIRVKLIESLPELTFGMGYPLNPINHSDVKKFFFQMGGRF